MADTELRGCSESVSKSFICKTDSNFLGKNVVKSNLLITNGTTAEALKFERVNPQLERREIYADAATAAVICFN